MSVVNPIFVMVRSALGRAASVPAFLVMLAGLALSQAAPLQVAAAASLNTRATVGGPIDPLDSAIVDHKADPEFHSLFTSWKRLDQLSRGTVAVPSQRPVDRMTFSSGFGVRTDPFRGYAAMHPGIDMPNPYGTPVYAAADGIVGRAEWANGYGNLVQIEHGKGIETRYGHLSAILVSANQRIHRGDLIGRVGSTGRSTGNHLHYEVRIDGHPVNPLPFLQGADYMLAVQARVARPGLPQVAVGGPETGTGAGE